MRVLAAIAFLCWLNVFIGTIFFGVAPSVLGTAVLSATLMIRSVIDIAKG